MSLFAKPYLLFSPLLFVRVQMLSRSVAALLLLAAAVCNAQVSFGAPEAEIVFFLFLFFFWKVFVFCHVWTEFFFVVVCVCELCAWSDRNTAALFTDEGEKHLDRVASQSVSAVLKSPDIHSCAEHTACYSVCFLKKSQLCLFIVGTLRNYELHCWDNPAPSCTKSPVRQFLSSGTFIIL